MANWLGVNPQTTFNFSPIDRPIPLEVHIQSFQINHFASLMISMSKPAYQAISQYSPNRKQCRLTASDIITHQYATSENPHFLHCKAEEMEAAVEKISDPYLKESLLSGIGLYHEALSPSDCNIVSKLYLNGWFQVLIASRDTCWSMSFNVQFQ
jgi:pre-mRNA-splicing helicase BRR2